MYISPERAKIVIEALRTYRDKLISTNDDAKPTKEFLDEIEAEQERLLEVKKLSKINNEIAEQINPQTGSPLKEGE